MITDTFKPSRALGVAGPAIQVYKPSAPRLSPLSKGITALVLAAMFILCIDVSIAHAQTTTLTDAHVMMLAQAAPPSGAKGKDRPPREAMEACAKQSAKTACSFAGRDGAQISGTCLSPKSDLPLACVPAQMPQDG